MTKNKEIKYYSRKFLNKGRGVAAIEIDFASWHFDVGFDCSVNISDCSRTVRLDFDVYTEKELKSAKDKLEGLILELCKLQAFIEDNEKGITEAMKKQQEERKKRILKRNGKKAVSIVGDLTNAGT
jgi:hypothetical protein